MVCGSGVLVALPGSHGWCHVSAAVSAKILCTPFIEPCTRLLCHIIQSHIGRVYACLAVKLPSALLAAE